MLANTASGSARKEKAAAIAASALGFIAADDDRLGHFFDVTGLSPGDIRQAVRQPGFLAGVLQHVMSDEAMAAAFAAEKGLSPEDLQSAAHQLGIAGE